MGLTTTPRAETEGPRRSLRHPDRSGPVIDFDELRARHPVPLSSAPVKVSRVSLSNVPTLACVVRRHQVALANLGSSTMVRLFTVMRSVELIRAYKLDGRLVTCAKDVLR